MNDKQWADVAKAFKALPEEPINYKSLFGHCPEIKSDHSNCRHCFGTMYHLTSDRAMAVLLQAGYTVNLYAAGENLANCTMVKYEIPSHVYHGSSPLHALLLAMGKIGE